MCKHCEGEMDYIEDVKDKRTEMSVGIESVNSDYYLNFYYEERCFSGAVVDRWVQINYCPMCGRKLTNGES